MSAIGATLASSAASTDPGPALRARRLFRFARLASLAALVASALVLVGWWAHVAVLTHLDVGPASMKPNTAAGLLLLGLSLWLQVGPLVHPAVPSLRRRLGRACALVAAIVGSATLAQYVFGIDLRIDGLLYRGAVAADGTLYPLRMAPATAVELIVLGAALALLDYEPRPGRRPAQGLAIVAAGIATLALVGYLYGVPSLYGTGPFSSIAVHTAAVLLLLSCGVLAARPGHGLAAILTSDQSGGLMMRRLLPLALTFPFVIGWLRLQGQLAGWYDTTFGLAIFATSNAAVFAVLVWATARSLDRLDAERHAAHDQARTSRKDAEKVQEASRLKSEFLANMSHELRTPLNAIIGFADLMHKGKVGPLSDDHREYMGDILTSSRHLLQLINDVLDLAKVESGRMEFRPTPVDLDTLIAEVRDVLRGLAASKRLRVESRVDPALGEVVVDAARVKQVLYNYLSNALKFTPEGGGVTIAAAADGPDHFRLAVTDSGIGIAPEDLGRLFREFQQLDAGAGKRFQGTGLGLALTKRIVESHGGRVEVRSAVGEGSTFSAILPRRTVASAAPGARERLAAAEAAASALSPSASGERPVLVVEDDPSAQRLVAAALSQLGCRPLSAYGAEEALRLAAAEPPCVVVLDLLMPGVDGFAFLARFGRLGLGDVPVVVWTIKDVTAEERLRLGPSVHAVIPKSSGDIAALVETLRPLLASRPEAAVEKTHGG